MFCDAGMETINTTLCSRNSIVTINDNGNAAS
jgi:hypothetical protein